MKVIGLDGRTYSINPAKYRRESNNASGLHVQARLLIKEVFPVDMVLEEVELPGSHGLAADFILPARHLMVEVHGEQHYKYVPHFHGRNRLNFVASQKRDRDKQEWCRLNGLTMIELPYDDTDNWTDRLLCRVPT